MTSKTMAMLLALLAEGCSAAPQGDLQKENLLLRAQLAELQARLKDCRASAAAMVDAKDIVGSGSGVDAMEANDGEEDAGGDAGNSFDVGGLTKKATAPGD